jgi:hypothetical protein
MELSPLQSSRHEPAGKVDGLAGALRPGQA